MAYVLSLSLVVLALVPLCWVLIRTLRTLRRLRSTQKMLASEFADRGGLLKARLAGVRLGIFQRWKRPAQRTY